MRVRIGWLAIVLAVVVSGCGGDPAPAAPTPQPPAVVRVEIEGALPLNGPGATLQLRAFASLNDGSRPEVTNEAEWAVTDPAVLTVNARGLITGHSLGTSLITATYRFNVATTLVRVR